MFIVNNCKVIAPNGHDSDENCNNRILVLV
jgi:hypothetical protein